MAAAQRQARAAAGIKRIEAKLKSAIDQENFYEAHQLYKTLFFRYVKKVVKSPRLMNNLFISFVIFTIFLQVFVSSQVFRS